MEKIVKKFPGVVALNGVDFDLRAGEVHILAGENGAGKSTLTKVMSGVYQADEGSIFYLGEKASFSNPREAIVQGIAVVYQEISVIPGLSIAENIFLAQEPLKNWGNLKTIDWHELNRRAKELLDQLGLDFEPRTKVSELTIGQAQMVEIARGISRKARILVLDEPTSSLSVQETETLFRIIALLKREGVGIVYISHRIRESFEIGDRITILRDGQLISTNEIKEVTEDKVVRLMVGRDLQGQFVKKEVSIKGEVLRLHSLNKIGVLHDIDLVVREGEIVGLAGLLGSGRTELAFAVFGADPYDSGTIEIHGRPIKIKSPRQAIEAGIAMVPEDRKGLGLLSNLSLRENLTLASLKRYCFGQWINKNREKSETEKYVSALAIKTPSIEKRVNDLSGGNQQKVVLAKWLAAQSRILILDEPTRGIDVGAKKEVYQVMSELAAQGCGILFISSELPEIISMSDRIYVMNAGRINAELPGGSHEATILNHALPVHAS
jgi:ribose transport system ATP-binding protein